MTGKLGSPGSRLGTFQLADPGATAPLDMDHVATDTGAATESASVAADLLAQDNATATDGGEVSTPPEPQELTDAGTAAETAMVGVVGHDAGIGTESLALEVVARETGVATETAAVQIGPIRKVTSVVRIHGPEQFLPSWTDAAQGTGILAALLTRLSRESETWADQADRIYLARWLSTAPVGISRHTWTVPCPWSPRDELRVQATVGGVTTLVRRAASRHDWESASDAVWWIDPGTPRVVLRNLHVREATLTPVSGVCELSDAPLPDSDLYWQDPEGTWRRHPGEDARGSMAYEFPVDGDVPVRWSSYARLQQVTAATITVMRGNARLAYSPQLERVQNLFDSYGAWLDIPRLLGEDNLTYRTRLLAQVQDPPGVALSSVVRAVASRLGILTLVEWDGQSGLTLDETGERKLTHVHVLATPPLREITEELVPEGLVDGVTVTWHASFPGWRPGALVLVNGLPRNDHTRTGATLTFSEPVGGRVVARYSYETWTVTRDENGYARSIAPGTGLLPLGERDRYIVACAREVDAHPVDLPGYQREHLLTPEGLPNGLFLQVVRQLTEDNPTVLGRANWGAGVWFARMDDRPQHSRLPLPFDAHGDESGG